MASERPKATPSAAHGPRVVVVGTASVLTSPTFREPLPLRGAALFVESAISSSRSRVGRGRSGTVVIVVRMSSSVARGSRPATTRTLSSKPSAGTRSVTNGAIPSLGAALYMGERTTIARLSTSPSTASGSMPTWARAARAATSASGLGEPDAGIRPASTRLGFRSPKAAPSSV